MSVRCPEPDCNRQLFHDEQDPARERAAFVFCPAHSDLMPLAELTPEAKRGIFYRVRKRCADCHAAIGAQGWHECIDGQLTPNRKFAKRGRTVEAADQPRLGAPGGEA